MGLHTDNLLPGMTDVLVRGYGVWHLIENTDHFKRRFEKAWRRKKFLDVHYAGTHFVLNPRAVMYFEGVL